MKDAAQIEPDLALAERLFDALREASLDPPGVTRDAYGPGEERAHALCLEAAEGAGLAVSRDFAGNSYATLAESDSEERTLIIGSHLDSVPHGGNYDGAAGVVAGLAALAGLVRADRRPRGDVTVMMTRAEESVWFPVSFAGARAAHRCLPVEALAAKRSDTGDTLAQHMRALGFEPEAIAAGQRHLDPARIAGFIEAHIEQGPELIEVGRAVAVVPAISGGYRFRKARITGVYAHVGGAPKRVRRDAVAALGHSIAGINAVWDRLDAEGHRIMATFGVVGVDPAMASWSRVPGEARFTLDIRGVDLPALARMRVALDDIVAEAESKYGVTVSLGPDTGPRPAFLDRDLLQRLRDCASARFIPFSRDAFGGRTRRSCVSRGRCPDRDAVHPQPAWQPHSRRGDGPCRLRRSRADSRHPGRDALNTTPSMPAKLIQSLDLATRLPEEHPTLNSETMGITREIVSTDERSARGILGRAREGVERGVSAGHACEPSLARAGPDRSSAAVMIGSRCHTVPRRRDLDGTAGVPRRPATVSGHGRPCFAPLRDATERAVRGKDTPARRSAKRTMLSGCRQDAAIFAHADTTPGTILVHIGKCCRIPDEDMCMEDVAKECPALAVLESRASC